MEISRRDVGTNIFNIQNQYAPNSYYANITVGTPPQLQAVILDTGSSDLYLYASNTTACNPPPANISICQSGTFNKSLSQTYREPYPSPAFDIEYADGTTATGPYGTDWFGIGSSNISGIQFGIGEDVNVPGTGLLGLGYNTNEAVQNVPMYPNFIDTLKNVGAIKSRLYSIWLGERASGQGTILFGGIDRNKYTGGLTTLNMERSLGSGMLDFRVNVTAVSVNQAGVTRNLTGSSNTPGIIDPFTVLLDTGTSANIVPRDIGNQIVSQFPYLNVMNTLRCSDIGEEDSIELTFGHKARITAKTKELTSPRLNSTTNAPIVDEHNNPLCESLLYPSDFVDRFVVGQAFLTSMYVVFDLDNGQISIAQAATDTSPPSAPVEVPAGPNGLASVVSAYSGGIATASPNLYSIVPGVVATVSNSLATLATPIGVEAAPLNGGFDSTATVSGRSSSTETASTFTTSTMRTAAAW